MLLGGSLQAATAARSSKTGTVDNTAPLLAVRSSLLPALVITSIIIVHGAEPVASCRAAVLPAITNGALGRLFLSASLSDVLSANTANDSVIDANPFTAVLATNINSIVSAAGILSVMIDNRDETILQEIGILSMNSVALLPRDDLARDFELQGISDLLPNLDGTMAFSIELEAFEMQNEDWRQRLNEHLLGSLCVLSMGRVKISVDRFWASKTPQSINDVANLGSTNIELKGLIGLQGNGALEARDAKFRAEVTTEDPSDRRDGRGITRSASNCSLLTGSNLEPVITSVGSRGRGQGRVGRSRGSRNRESTHDMGALVVETFKKETEELLGILLMTAAHAGETRELSDSVIDKLGGKGFTVLLEFLALEAPLELVNRHSRIDHLELAHKHDHGIEERSLAIEAVGSLLADLIQEVVERNAVNQNLKNLQAELVSTLEAYRKTGATYRVHIAHVTSVDEAAGLQESNLLSGANPVRLNSLSHRVRLRLSKAGDNSSSSS